MAFLLDLKALMEHAILHQQSGTKLDMRLAINHAHQAVELTLRKKAELLGENPFGFPDVMKALKGHVKIPYERQMEELNKTRTLIQHYGTTPNDNDARRLIFVARDFLAEFWKEAFGVDYDDVSLFDLITNAKVKELLVEAAKGVKAGNHDKTAANSVQATYEVQWGIQKRFRGRPTKLTGFEVVGLEDVLDFVLNVALSSPFAYKLWKLKETTGIVYLPIPEGEPVMQRFKEHNTREDAMYALELATEYALWAEQVYG